MAERSEGVRLPAGFVRLGFLEGNPVIIVRDRRGREVARRVADHKPYKRALASDAARRHRGAIKKLAAYDRGEVEYGAAVRR
jgi:hypothetical protein